MTSLVCLFSCQPRWIVNTSCKNLSVSFLWGFTSFLSKTFHSNQTKHEGGETYLEVKYWKDKQQRYLGHSNRWELWNITFSSQRPLNTSKCFLTHLQQKHGLLLALDSYHTYVTQLTIQNKDAFSQWVSLFECLNHSHQLNRQTKCGNRKGDFHGYTKRWIVNVLKLSEKNVRGDTKSELKIELDIIMIDTHHGWAA